LNQNYNQFLDFWNLFPSLPWVVELLVGKGKIELGIRCLELSAGFGGVAVAMQKLNGNVQVIKPLPQLQAILTLQNLLVIGSDFLTANTANSFQLVVQNSRVIQ
jgi:hypothetical protein